MYSRQNTMSNSLFIQKILLQWPVYEIHNNDQLRIYFGDTTNADYKQFGYATPPDVVSTDEHLLINFKSSPHLTDKGFKATWTVLGELPDI